jgi:hypothetical protein
MPTPTKVELAQSCIADSERAENCYGTRVDAAIQAIAYLDPSLLTDPGFQRYLERKYQHPLNATELQEYHAYALGLAKTLMSTVEPATEVVTVAWPESAADLLDALRKGPPTRVTLFGGPCSPDEASAVLAAADPLQAARDLMAKRLNEWGARK